MFTFAEGFIETNKSKTKNEARGREHASCFISTFKVLQVLTSPGNCLRKFKSR